MPALLYPACLLLAALLVGCGPAGDDGFNGPGAQTLTVDPRVADYLRSDRFTRLVLEVDAIAGSEPFDESRARLAARLAEILDKPDGIEVLADGTLPSRGRDHAWTFAELRELAANHFDLAVAADTIKMHVLFLDGRYAAPEGGTVLGLAWGQAFIAIFKDSIEASCNGGLIVDPGLCVETELAVWIHEVGHVLGLVDNGLPMQSDHEDPEHPGHSRNPDCVMYWAYEGDAVVQRIREASLGGNPALDFDADCLADIAAVRDAPARAGTR